MNEDQEVDAGLLHEAQELSDLPMTHAVINEALRQYIKWRRRMKVLDMAGTIDFDPDYDYKKARSL